jgi:hypothetical protein
VRSYDVSDVNADFLEPEPVSDDLTNAFTVHCANRLPNQFEPDGVAVQLPDCFAGRVAEPDGVTVYFTDDGTDHESHHITVAKSNDLANGITGMSR